MGVKWTINGAEMDRKWFFAAIFNIQPESFLAPVARRYPLRTSMIHPDTISGGITKLPEGVYCERVRGAVTNARLTALVALNG